MKQSRSIARKGASAAVLALALALGGCLLDVFAPASNQEDNLRTARELWQRQGITDYRYALLRRCFCPEEARGPVRVEVRGGQTASVVPVQSGQTVRTEQFATLDTVEELFATIEQIIARDPYLLTVRYDPERGFPTYVFADYERSAVDEENGFQVGEFQLLP